MDTQREQEQTLRTEIYLVLSALFRSAPSEEMIEFLTSLEVEPSESAMQKRGLHFSKRQKIPTVKR